jgi:hypothetical protein
VLVAFPTLRINNLAFSYIVVPALELFYSYLGSRSLPSALSLLRLLPLLAIAVLFPNVVYHDLVRRTQTHTHTHTHTRAGQAGQHTPIRLYAHTRTHAYMLILILFFLF